MDTKMSFNINLFYSFQNNYNYSIIVYYRTPHQWLLIIKTCPQKTNEMTTENDF